MKNKTVLVTGAAGFIGFHLTNKLIKEKFSVIGLDNINNYYDIDLKFARLEELGITKSKAKVYNIQDKVRLQNDGYILWIRPATFSFSCPLSLKEFPTDSQTCSMIFGSWSFPENQLLITPFNYNYDIDYLKQNNIFFNNRIVNNNNKYYNYNC